MSKTQDYSNWEKNELIRQIEKLEKHKKYGLVWDEERTKEQFEKESEHALPVLKEVKNKEINTDPLKPINILIEGDNYHALSVLNYTHEGKIDVIYIDPPYNTGNKSWKYNNSFVELDDSFKHSKWLSFMSKRLKLAKSLLSEDGIICVTIDDHELPRLWMLLEEIFGEDNHLGTIAIRNNPKGRKTQRKVSLVHEYAIFFGKNGNTSIKKVPIEIEEKTHTYVQDKDGSWYLGINLRKQRVDSLAVNRKGKRSERWYTIYFDPKSGRVSTKDKLKVKILPIDPNGQERIWRRGKDVIDEMYTSGDLWCKETRNGTQLYYKFRGGLDGEPPESIWYDSKFSASEYGTKMLEDILSKRESFPYPKSPFAIEECIKICSIKSDSIVLDFFAGSGTTMQAVLNMNVLDNGLRKCILCTNNENNIALEVCYPRIVNVIKGYKTPKGEEVQGLGGNLKYFKTDFVPKSYTDQNKKYITENSSEMLCLRESTFDLVEKTKDWNIYKNSEYLTAILFDINKIENFINRIEKQRMPAHIYIFSLSDDTYEEKFTDIKIPITLCPIPEAILKVYRRIFK